MPSQGEDFLESHLSRESELLLEREDDLQIEKERLKRESRKRNILIFLLLLLVFFLLLGLIYSIYLVSEETKIKSKAESSSLTRQVDFVNSYLFASPLRAKAASGERIRITVFLLDSKGLGVSGKRVALGRNPNLGIDEIQAMTDEVGKAVFDISSNLPSVYLIEASVDGKIIPQRLSVTFD